MKRIVSWFLLLFFVSSYAFAGDLELTATNKMDNNSRKTAVKSWNKVKRALPGLDEYAQDLKVMSVEKTTKGLTFQIQVSQSPRQIPAAFKAAGHNCYIEVDKKLKKCSLSKRSCISVATQINAFDPALSASLKGGPLVIKLD